MKATRIISILLVTAFLLATPAVNGVAGEGLPWFGVIGYLVTGGPPSNKKPLATFFADPTSGDAPLTVSFDGSESADPDGSIKSYEWDFGDGTTDTGEEVTHTYYDSGEFIAELTVKDDGGKVDKYDRTITVGSTSNQKPEASFIASPETGTEPLEVSFDASGASDADGTVENYSWDFGDGATGSGKVVSHTYSSSGEFSAQLTVEDDDGAESSSSVIISVTENQQPTASISASPTSGVVPLEVSFDASSSFDSDGNITDYEWDFGDGTTGTGSTVTHTFDNTGNFSVDLTVTDDDGDKDVSTKSISVTSSSEGQKVEVLDWSIMEHSCTGKAQIVGTVKNVSGVEIYSFTVATRLYDSFDELLEKDDDLVFGLDAGSTAEFTIYTSTDYWEVDRAEVFIDSVST